MYLGILGFHNNEVIYINDWLKENEKHFLKIKDIENLNKGDTLELLCIDRNFFDMLDYNPSNIPMNSLDFFKNNYIIEYTHSHNLIGKIRDNSSNINSNETFNFEFHIEYLKKHWYPLKNGKLPSKDKLGIPSLIKMDFIKRDWKEYSKYTKIGWRGPMIPIKYVKNSPLIYH